MNPHDMIVMRVLAARINDVETANQQLQAVIAEKDKRIGELEASNQAATAEKDARIAELETTVASQNLLLSAEPVGDAA